MFLEYRIKSQVQKPNEHVSLESNPLAVPSTRDTPYKLWSGGRGCSKDQRP